uniref:Tetraspanin n=1 Tax=Macrostomum lignano TaxID=282301 RepID=A0A1I8FRS4_9PLAT
SSHRSDPPRRAVHLRFSLFSSVLESSIKSATSDIATALKSGFNIDLDVYALLKNISAVTGGLGAALMVIGILVLLLSCFGCCGASCKAQSCLVIYGFIVALVFLAQVIVVIVWFASSDTFKSSVKSEMEQSLKKFTGISSKNIQTLLQNLLQIFVGCCGVNNGTDFETMSPKWNRTYSISDLPRDLLQVQPDFVSPEDANCPLNNTNSHYRRAAFEAMFDFIEQYMKLNAVFYALGGILGYEALLIAGAIIIHRASDDSNKVKPQ